MQRQNILNTSIEEEMKKSYMDYSMSVIVSRALPDVRDGLKPVHRRILYGMMELGVGYNRAYRKSARIVGDVMGKYHPHGDSAVYDSMVRMTQEFSLRYPLVDGQGNFGSIDGDSAAAMRYTEARMKRISSEMLKDLEKETVTFTPNFDESLQEPTVLAAVIPNLLLNGSSGIAVGMATNIPPHNMNEVVDAIVTQIDNPDVEVAELMEHVKGPDFPTAAVIYGAAGIKDAYETGRGKITVRARASIEERKNGRYSLVITEIPYQVNKSSLIEKIVMLVRTKKVEGISDIRDESDKDGIRLVIELKRDVVPEVLLNLLYKHTQMQDTFGVIMLALVDGLPKVLTLKEVIAEFIKFRHEVVVKRTQFELKEAEARAHILEGLKIALDNLDAIIKTIRGSKNPKEAKAALVSKFELSEIQAQAILDMRLQKLTGLERQKIIDEYTEVLKIIARLNEILNNRGLRMDIIKTELRDVQERYGDERRTEIIPDAKDFTIEDMIAEEEMVITITHNGFIKRYPVSGYRRQNRGGRGSAGAKARDEDFIEHLFTASTHDYILFFTDRGKCHWLRVHEIPQAGKATRGRALINLLQVDQGEKVQAYIAVRDYAEDLFITMATAKGLVKKTILTAYSRPMKGGIFAIDIREDDYLIDAQITNGENDIILGTRNGMSIRFSETNIRPTGRKTMGVKGIELKGDDDQVVGMIVVRREGTVLAVSEHGFGKRTEVINYRVQNRAGKGIITIKTTPKVGSMVSLLEVVDNDDLMIITSRGVLIRQPVSSIRSIGRNTQGVKLIRLDDGDSIAAVTRVQEEKDPSEIEPTEGETPEVEQKDIFDGEGETPPAE
ncbi:MAG: DNA gyrase subunit A [Candidatus Marinimicrobia bacterium]|nr:DNA gyrase subunit A [Candidatus Neomarinimicrobiota bacterium]MBT3575672.1 DNA gyrase subunit A [Candidatus Neomarinimicrobiota bacterium]MBT3679845.1 DNA gyrase subunit A [Candidatus Neomarinimicrobiota bacterium]MBT3952069.1 DNA gyrase subunit A [Candidatus Neomarinimicrobiota bacterium]MBT4251960.1 DNA gyrase subunit A [Candidatus Neomarinimicrobiota bacterium]